MPDSLVGSGVEVSSGSLNVGVATGTECGPAFEELGTGGGIEGAEGLKDLYLLGLLNDALGESGTFGAATLVSKLGMLCFGSVKLPVRFAEFGLGLSTGFGLGMEAKPEIGFGNTGAPLGAEMPFGAGGLGA